MGKLAKNWQCKQLKKRLLYNFIIYVLVNSMPCGSLLYVIKFDNYYMGLVVGDYIIDNIDCYTCQDASTNEECRIHTTMCPHYTHVSKDPVHTIFM